MNKPDCPRSRSATNAVYKRKVLIRRYHCYIYDGFKIEDLENEFNQWVASFTGQFAETPKWQDGYFYIAGGEDGVECRILIPYVYGETISDEDMPRN